MRKFTLLALIWILLGSTGYTADFFCESGNVGCLISAIEVSNGNGQDNTIFLEEGEYTIHAFNNRTDADNGLPVISGRISIRGPEGTGSTIERDPAAKEFRIFQVDPTGYLTLDWLGIRNGELSAQLPVVEACGGAIYNRGRLTISRNAIYNNTAWITGGGGAICNVGVLYVSNSEFYNNFDYSEPGGAINSSGQMFVEDSVFTDNKAGFGAAISNSGSAQLIRTTLSKNEAGYGSGVNNEGTLWIENSSSNHNTGAALFNRGTLTVVNTTVSDNFSSTTGAGGIHNLGVLFVKNSTIVYNTSYRLPAGLQTTNVAARVQNSIVAFNLAIHTELGRSVPADCGFILTSLGNNIFGTTDGCTVTLRSTDTVGDPLLGPFMEDETPGSGHFPLTPNSPAIDRASDGACSPFDQIGEQRNELCDIGAVELPPVEEIGSGHGGRGDHANRGNPPKRARRWLVPRGRGRNSN